MARNLINMYYSHRSPASTHISCLSDYRAYFMCVQTDTSRHVPSLPGADYKFRQGKAFLAPHF